MPNDHRAKLATIKRFDQLIAYLRDEMGWPLQDATWDELTFDFTADELGIDPKTAAKIEEIKRLRPLSPKQPWGIFFVKFEPKRLPVVALRRILSQVALKKRASANSAERAAWAADDLLFVSNYGEGEQRQISFAHFSRARDGHDLPTLKVLGWDNLDTALHLDAIARELSENLAWPDDDDNVEAWRARWCSAFTLRHREVVTTSKELSIRLAELARAIRERIKAALSIETDKGPLTKLMKAFQTALVHDLDVDGFADMYAQTIGYGLLSARIAAPDKRTADDFAAHLRTNPFLRELMETFLRVGGRRGKAGGPGLDFDELGVSDVVALLDEANMEAVVRDFGDRNPQEDPVIHFYELFLKEYDAKGRIQRGVFYTPRPVVSYIVRAVDEVLRTEFGLADGLADTVTWGEMASRHSAMRIPDGVSPDQDFVQILDPATGTGTFLVEVIDLIHRTLVAKWNAQGHGSKKIDALWNEYVPKHLLPRLHGYELLMAPYSIAHLKLGLKLLETRYKSKSDQRVGVYLTNSLEPASSIGQMRLSGVLPALAHEANAVNEVKLRRRFTVVLGNPPYSGRSYNLTDSAREMVNRYKFIDGIRILEKGALQLEKNLNDDYVKFIRLAQDLTVGVPSVVCMITNHSFLENPTLRGLRWSLLQQYRMMRLVDLGGNVARRESGDDDNVFDISQGVAISVLASPPTTGPARIELARARGVREAKYAALSGQSVLCQRAEPVAPLFLFRKEDAEVRAEYGAGVSLVELFPVNSTGVKTHRDGFCIDFDKNALLGRIQDLVASDLSDAEIRAKYGLEDTHGWRLATCRARLRMEPHWQDAFGQILYRPFDWRHIYFSPHVVELTRMEVSGSFRGRDNVGLVFMRQSAGGEPYSHFLVTRDPVDNRCFYSNRGTMSFAPLRLRHTGPVSGDLYAGCVGDGWTVNMRPESVSRLCAAVAGCMDGQPVPERVLAYCYAVFSSPSYRKRYAEFLKVDFPRVPLPTESGLWRELAVRGQELIALHLLEGVAPRFDLGDYVGPRCPTVGRVAWTDGWIRFDAESGTGSGSGAPQFCGFRNVPEEVWTFHVGGYQVCEKWLKDRKGRTLSDGDLAHYQKVIGALSETIRLMKEIDDVIDGYGGWPSAFQPGLAGTASLVKKAAEGSSNYGAARQRSES